MDGNYIISGNFYFQITQPELWEKCKTEKEYFAVLKEQQLKKIKTLLPGITGKGKEELGF